MNRATTTKALDHLMEHVWGPEQQEEVLQNIRLKSDYTEEQIKAWLGGHCNMNLDRIYEREYFAVRAQLLLNLVGTAIAIDHGCSCPTIRIQMSFENYLETLELELVENADGSYDVEDYLVATTAA